MTDPGDTRAPARASLRIHVLDSARGAVAEGLLVEILRLGQDAEKRFSGKLGADGMPVDPDRRASRLEPGEYEVVFHLGDYYRARSGDALGPPVLQSVTLRLGIADARLAYDLPLRISPSGIRMPGA